MLNPLTSGESLIFVWAKLEAQVSWPWGWLFLFRTIIALEQVFCTIIKGFCCDFFFISLQKMFESFPVPYSNVDMSQGLSNVFNQVKIFTLSKYFLVRLVSYPTRWSLYSSLDFCVDHLSWQWRPHIAGCKMFLTLLRAELAVLTHFFCQMYQWYMWGRQKPENGVFFLLFSPQNDLESWPKTVFQK